MQPANNIDLSRFDQMFLDEAADLLQVLESGLLALDSKAFDGRDAGSSEHLNAIFRAAHSLKGSAGMTGWETVAEFTHVVEGILDELRSGKRQPEKHLTANLLRAVDNLRSMLENPRTEPLSADAKRCLKELHSPIRPVQPVQEVASESVAPDEYLIDWTPPTDCLIRGVDPLRVLSTLASLGTISRSACNTNALPELSGLDPSASYLSWSIRLQTTRAISEIYDVFTFQALDENLSITEWKPEPKAEASFSNLETIRVAAAKLDAIFNLVGEMVITQSMASLAIETYRNTNPQLDLTIQELKRQTRELQDRIMGLRLVPVEQVFRRFPRLVHDLSHQCNKQINLEINGTETEIDRALVEQISDPLVHLIRNCADHGIEESEQRRLAGKPPIGLIRLTARCQGGSTIVELEDDGRGIDPERIRAKGLNLGLLQPNINYTEKHLQSLIFHPGFSTADKVTTVSGRGVGMDAVSRSVEALSGSIAMQSTLGKGTKFTIHLPMTLAILDGLLVSASGHVLVLPLAAVLQCKQVKPGEMRMLPAGQSNRFQYLLASANSLLPILPLSRLLNQPPAKPDAGMAILTEHNGHQLALLADEILGQQQVVIKSLETNYRRIEGLQGATILGDGRVALVVDLAALTRIQERLRQCS